MLKWTTVSWGRTLLTSHGTWSISPDPSEPLFRLRYGRPDNKYGIAYPEQIGHFASEAEAMLAVEIYEDPERRVAVSELCPGPEWQANPYSADLYSTHIDAYYLTFKIGTDGVYCDLDLKGDGWTTPVGGLDACSRTSENPSADRVFCDRPPGLSQSRDLDAGIMLEILKARMAMGDAATPLTEARVEVWLKRRTEASVYVLVSGKPSNALDRDIPGLYRIDVDAGLTPEQRAEVALDHFHDRNAVACLDDFEIGVHAADGALLPRMETYAERSLMERGRYREKVGGAVNDSSAFHSRRAERDTPSTDSKTNPATDMGL